jgi:hypothetical protein
VELATPLDEALLREQLATARERLRRLVANLRAVDGVLAGFATQRQQHALLGDACGALEKLEALGGANLFWGELASQGRAQIQQARARIEGFEKIIAEIESRRDALLDEIEQQQREGGWLEDDILEAQEQEARRAEEWLVEREVDAFPVQRLLLPWTRGGEDDWRFRKSLASSLLVALLIALTAPLIELPRLEPPPAEELTRLTRLLLPKPTPLQPLAPTKPPEHKPVPADKPIVAEKASAQRAPEKAPEDAPGARGILAFKDQLAGLADSKPVPALGRDARITREGEAASGPPERSLVTTRAAGSSGGINLAERSRGVGGGGGQELEGVQVARAASSIAGHGAGGSGRVAGGEGPQAGRTDEEIQIVFDRHKAALYRLYNRELRNDPTLRGQMILRLTIEPDGSVSMCALHGSDMKAPELASQVVDRVKTFDFGAKEGIVAVTILYPIDFLPAT